MERTRDYGGGLTAEQFLFPEMRICAGLFLEGRTADETVAAIRAENLFQYPTERQISRIARACYKRLEALNSRDLARALLSGPRDGAKQICLYAMMRYNALVWDFMTRVIGEKLLAQDFTLTRGDMNGFFAELRASHEEIAGWSEATVNKIKSVLIKSLVETEYLETVRSTTLIPILIYEELEQGIRDNGDQEALAAFCCFQ